MGDNTNKVLRTLMARIKCPINIRFFFLKEDLKWKAFDINSKGDSSFQVAFVCIQDLIQGYIGIFPWQPDSSWSLITAVVGHHFWCPNFLAHFGA